MSGVSYKSEDGVDRVALAHLTIVCDGMYSNLRKSLADPKVRGRGGWYNLNHPRPTLALNHVYICLPLQIKHPSFFVGIILRGVKLPVPNHGHVVLAKPSPILFYPISSTEIR